MNEERMMILQMLKDGTVTLEEAERLIAALPPSGSSAGSSAPPLPESSGAATLKIMPKRFLVLVTEKGRPKVNVKIPFSLLRAGLKIGQSFSSLAAKHIGEGAPEREAIEALRNIDIDELVACIGDGEIALPYTMVEVQEEENDTYVKVVLE